MDCRKPLLVALVVVCGLAGCKTSTPTQTAAISQPLPPAPVTTVTLKKEEDQPKRAPKALTCASYGRFAADEADKPGISPVEAQEKRDVARKAYQQALRIDPKCLEAYQGLGRLYIAMKDYRAATKTYLEGQRHFPKEPSLYYELGMCHAQQKEWEPALQNLSKAAELDPEERFYNHYLGYALARAGRYDDSLKVFERLESEQEAHYHVACMLRHLNQLDLCREHLQTALLKDPQMQPALALLSELNAPAPPQPIQQTNYTEETPH